MLVRNSGFFSLMVTGSLSPFSRQGEPKGVSSWIVLMAFPTSHSRPDGTGNPVPTWWGGPVRVLAQTESRAKPDGERDRIPLSLVAVSTARLSAFSGVTGEYPYPDPTCVLSPTSS